MYMEEKVYIDNTQLPNTLQDASSLPVIFATFERMRTYQGAGFVDLTFIRNDGFQDQLNLWHHNQCELFLKKIGATDAKH